MVGTRMLAKKIGKGLKRNRGEKLGDEMGEKDKLK